MESVSAAQDKPDRQKNPSALFAINAPKPYRHKKGDDLTKQCGGNYNLLE
jgi:hypothetical protein